MTGVFDRQGKFKELKGKLTQQQEANGNSNQTGQTSNAADTVRPFFKGLVTKVDLRYFRDNYQLMVEGISYTGLLDLELRSRTYQSAALTYTESTVRNKLISQVSIVKIYI